MNNPMKFQGRTIFIEPQTDEELAFLNMALLDPTVFLSFGAFLDEVRGSMMAMVNSRTMVAHQKGDWRCSEKELAETMRGAMNSWLSDERKMRAMKAMATCVLVLRGFIVTQMNDDQEKGIKL